LPILPFTPHAPSGGPPIDEGADRRAGRCTLCARLRAPGESEECAYERFRAGLSRRRVRWPTGSCDRALLGDRRTPVFSATTAETGCGNFEPAAANPRPGGGGFVTAWEAGRIVWQGPQEGVPVRFVQQDLPFANDGQAKA